VRSHVIFWLVAAAGTAADLLTKSLVFERLGGPGGRTWTLLPPILDLHCTTNRGGVFGVLQGASNVFVFLSFLALALVYWFFLSTRRRTGRTVVPLALIAAGTVGNLYDRLRFGHVRDFIDFHVGTYSWPTFNVADTWICVGAGVLMFLLLFDKSLQEQPHAG
jgi:signal peptidase II